MSKWIIVLSPEGGARAIGEQLVPIFIRRLGSGNVKVFDSDLYQRGFQGMLIQPDPDTVADMMNQQLVIQCLDFEATHLLVLALSPVTIFTLNLLKKVGVVNIHWFYEDYREALYWKSVLGGYHFFFGIQKGPLALAARKQDVPFYYLPTAAMNFPVPAGGLSLKTFDIAFIGIPSPYRVRVLESLSAAGFTLMVAGSQWEKYQGPLEKHITSRIWLGPAQSYSVYCRARAGLNLSFHEPGEDRENIHIPPRVYDILRCGLLLLTEETPLLSETLGDMYYVTFRTASELPQKAQQALADNPVRIEQCRINSEKINSLHTYENRVDEIFRVTGA